MNLRNSSTETPRKILEPTLGGIPGEALDDLLAKSRQEFLGEALDEFLVEFLEEFEEKIYLN